MASFVRRSMIAFRMMCKRFIAMPVRPFLTSDEIRALNTCQLSSGRARRNWNKLNSSSTLFWIGVPVKHHLYLALSSTAALAVCVLWFLMFCASSRVSFIRKTTPHRRQYAAT